jgi:EAL domain-containing protein (putative c-di-GMP-specific phosphodiesterase class I)
MERFGLETSLRRALERGEFLVYYQPVVRLATGEVTGVEALVRWMHPEKGLLLPSAFLPVAVDAGLMDDLGRWVLFTACSEAGAWNRERLPPIRLSVNLSAQELIRPDLPGLVGEALRTSGLEPAHLELEITEEFLIEQSDVALQVMKAVRDLGVTFSIDDFGTGYSSLSQLRRLPVDRLKLDQSFLRSIPGDSEDEAIARAVIALGHSLGLPVVAEGIEREEQISILVAGGCDEGQGFLLSPAVPAGQIPMLRGTRLPGRRVPSP